MIKRARDLAAGGIAVRVQDAIAAVRAFEREQQFGAFAIELDAPLDQFLNRGRAFLHENANGVAIARPAPATSCPVHGALLHRHR